MVCGTREKLKLDRFRNPWNEAQEMLSLIGIFDNFLNEIEENTDAEVQFEF